MLDHDPITLWIDGLKAGEQEAAHHLWDRYFRRLVQFVNRKLPTHGRRAFDEEDVALSAFKSFCAGIAKDRFPDLRQEDNLWSVLAVIASRKAQAYLRHEGRQKRGGGKVGGESVLGQPGAPGAGAGLDALSSQDPSPDLAAQFAEECERLLDALADDTHRAIAVLKMQGHTIEEIADRVGCTRRAVQRRLDIIRRTWGEAAPPAQKEDG